MSSNQLELLALLSARTVNLSAVGGGVSRIDWTDVSAALRHLDVLQQRYIYYTYCDEDKHFVTLQLELASMIQKRDQSLWAFNFLDVTRCVKGVLMQCRMDRCGVCKGTGLKGQTGQLCDDCNGDGYSAVTGREWGRRTGVHYERRLKLSSISAVAVNWCREADWKAASAIKSELFDSAAKKSA